MVFEGGKVSARGEGDGRDSQVQWTDEKSAKVSDGVQKFTGNLETSRKRSKRTREY